MLLAERVGAAMPRLRLAAPDMSAVRTEAEVERRSTLLAPVPARRRDHAGRVLARGRLGLGEVHGVHPTRERLENDAGLAAWDVPTPFGGLARGQWREWS